MFSKIIILGENDRILIRDKYVLTHKSLESNEQLLIVAFEQPLEDPGCVLDHLAELISALYNKEQLSLITLDHSPIYK